jgi:predicted amidohydrolase YtcJ
MTQPADILITNAAVYTVDEALPHAEAVAVRGNRIVFVGSAAEGASWRGPRTEVIDGRRATLLPGLIDSHFHLMWGSLKLADLQLWDAEDMEQLATLIRDHAAAEPARQWITGSQLRYKTISAGQPLTRQWLDALVADRPVYLTAYDGHTVWANTEALRRGGILHGRELPAGHEIVIDPATGEATGELREPEAFRPIRDLIPKPSESEKRSLLHNGLALAAQHGITSAHNMDTWDESIHLYAALDDLGEMSLRLYVPYNVTPETPLEALGEAAEWKGRYQSSHLRAGAVKCFMDGVLESYTALMVDDYAAPTGHPPGNRGSALFSAEHFNRVATEADRLGLQIAVHCCGDGAVKRALDGFAHAQRVNGKRDGRHRIEHIEVIDPPDIPRFAQLGVIASMQPLHAPETIAAGDVWPLRAGEARWPYSFPWQTLREAGAHLAFGSDWPVVTLDPLLGFYAALNREPWQESDPLQRQTLAQVIAGYTRDAAFVEFQEQQKGMIRRGMLADLVLFSADLFATPPEAIAQVRPVLTLCDGRVVYRA